MAVGLALATLASGCGGSSGGQSTEPGHERTAAIETNAAVAAPSLASKYAQLEAEAQRWEGIANQAEAAARSDLSGGRYRASENDGAALTHANHEIERIARAIEGEAVALRHARGRSESER